MLKKVLIANRGAIAVRIIRTLKAMNINSVAVYSEEDKDSLHVAAADEAVCLGSGAAKQTYLDQDKLLAACKELHVDAVHPGYGFLSENPEFVSRCEQNNVIFLGPTAEQMKVFGLKHTARDLAGQANVPLLSGTALLADLEEAKHSAANIGYPVMLKSTAGGGGIGMQICYCEQELTDCYESVKRLGENNFANAGVFLEKYIEHARHIEVQVFGDGKGKVVALGERDCSSQRRNQKVIEETPAPNLPDETRKALHQTAISLAASVNYRSAGTVEFILDQQSNEFYFLEVNTRLQVEHGVTEEIYGVDIVSWMVQLGFGNLQKLGELEDDLEAKGHAIQVRIYAEDPQKDFQPSAGLLSHVVFPENEHYRIDHWIEAGVTVSPFFDPMLAKFICYADNREQAIKNLKTGLAESEIYGIETNLDYLQTILNEDIFVNGKIYTRFLNSYAYQANSVEVISAGTMTTVQDFPGRTGYWDVGVPPSGPFDALSFQLANQLLGNDKSAAALELTLNGPSLKFNADTVIALCGATMKTTLDGESVEFWQTIEVKAGQILSVGQAAEAGARAYLAVQGGIQCPEYLGSRATFTLGQFGGHGGRALRTGDVLHYSAAEKTFSPAVIPKGKQPVLSNTWTLHVIYGPHGAPDFFTDNDMQEFFSADWQVHYNSSRTGVRLIGPKPEWARSDGGEAGMHPSNIHDNAYAIGTVDFTGDMPVILGPDGPSLGGFVCPATVIQADLWKLGQLKAGDKIKFVPVSIEDAVEARRRLMSSIPELAIEELQLQAKELTTPVIKQLQAENLHQCWTFRPSGDDYLLVEFGELKLDIELRFKAHALLLWLNENPLDGVLDITPGIRSLQIHYNSLQLSLEKLLAHLELASAQLENIDDMEVPTRTIHLPLSWDDEACRLAIEKYMQSVRSDAPWCPSNIEFIRRINGLDDIQQVKQIVFDADYLVMGLGDVYLGAPVATPLDPRHRLVTTKYNPARTWTAENSVGIGGSYLCIYGMEGPGGYQFVGRTLQMWNKYRETAEFDKPWLLEFFDVIKFYEVSAEELVEIREKFPKGQYPLNIENSTFSVKQYKQFLADNCEDIKAFTDKRDESFEAELQRWIESGQINFSVEIAEQENDEEFSLAENEFAIESGVSGNVWEVLVQEEQTVSAGDTLMVIESMKMEIPVLAHKAGTVKTILRGQGKTVSPGQMLLVLEER